MTKFSFGAYVKVLNLCKPSPQKPSQEVLLAAVIGSLYPPHTDLNNYGLDRSTISLYLSCKRELKEDFVEKARGADPDKVEEHFYKRVVTVLSDRKYANAVLAIRDLILKDDGIRDDTIIDVIGKTTKYALRSQSVFFLSEFLAGVFLYAATPDESKEARETVKSITAEHLSSFDAESGTITFADRSLRKMLRDVNALPMPKGSIPESAIVIPERILNFTENKKDDIINWLPYAQAFFSERPHYYSGYNFQRITHINEMFKYINCLIPESQKLSEDTALALVVSVVLHDIGRQLTRDGFLKLMKLPLWKENWHGFYSRACRFSDAKQIERFGKMINVAEAFPKRCINTSIETNEQILVISDFFNEMHSDMSYEMIKTNEDLNTGKRLLNFDIDDNFRDLIGRIAQNHKYPLRHAEPLLRESNYGGLHSDNPMGIPVYYLMVLLRISDYIDARARELVASIGLVSEEQNALQGVIRSIVFPPDSRQHGAILVEAYPRDTRTFVVTREWLEGIQYELDLSWAVLSEKYKNEFPLTVHRIYSNVTDDVAVTGFQKKFVTDKPYLKADTNILGHLIAPLYGNDASYGVRELIANAVDAVNERIYVNDKSYRPFTRRVNVCISKDEDTDVKNRFLFTITDTGIGMTLDVILNYYLTSGVSFRESEEWKKLFESGKKIKVTRTGRFGVGALAAFLIGDSITVTTRHMDEKEKGYKFTFTLSSEIINIDRVDCEIGTKIEIPITNERYVQAMTKFPRNFEEKKNGSYSQMINLGRNLSNEEAIQYTGFGCYRYSKPIVEYIYCGAKINAQFNIIPCKSEIQRGRFSDWYAFKTDSYFVAWKPSAVSPRKQARYFCNGFRFSSVTNVIGREYGYSMGHPIFSAEDTLGSFTCDLARDKITLPSDFILELFRHKLSLLFGLDVMRILKSKKSISELFSNRYMLLLSPSGYTLNNSLFVAHTQIPSRYIPLNTNRCKYELTTIDIEDIKSINNQINLNFGNNLKVLAGDALPKQYKNFKESDLSNSPINLSELSKDFFYEDEVWHNHDWPIGEKQLMDSLGELIPFERNGGLIPYDLDKRIQMYPEAFAHFKEMKYLNNYVLERLSVLQEGK